MKKYLKLISLLFVVMSLTGCIKKDSYENINIYTTVYPVTFISKYLYNDYSKIKSIFPSGIDPNNYTLTNKKINDFSKGDLFIYNGLSSEKDIAATLLNKNRKMDIIDVSQGLEVKNHVTELWLSPSNFLMMTSNVKNNLKEYIQNKTILESIDKKYDELKDIISKCDAELEIIADDASNKNIIVADNTFKFLNKYGFDIISISTDDENSNTNISRAKKYFSSKENKYLFMLDTTEENDTIKSLVTEGAKIIKIPTMYTLTEEQNKNNVTYITIINDFIEQIKSEVF